MIDLKNIFANTKLMNVVLTAFCIMVDKLESGYLELSFFLSDTTEATNLL